MVKRLTKHGNSLALVIDKGVKAGERIIVEGLEKVRTGDKVAPTAVQAPTAVSSPPK